MFALESVSVDWCMRVLVRPNKGIEIPLKSLYGHLPEILFHPLLQKAKGRLLVNQEKIEIIDQKILFWE
jgi:hypothetical protein